MREKVKKVAYMSMKMNEVDGCHQIQVQLTNKVAADGISMISGVPNMIDDNGKLV
jgi:hypothetical protein